jgi:RimJ/RimL family protein N-acetyltransferase
MYYLPDILTHSIDGSRQNLDVAIAESKTPNRTKFFFAIEHGDTGAFIGTVGYTASQTTPLGKFVGAGYFILPEHHGQGYMTEALGEVIRFAFEDNNVYRISTGCLIENRSSERVMQKCGFIKEAEYKSFVWHDGRVKDRVEYRLLRDEWLLTIERQASNSDDIIFTDREIIKSELDSIYDDFKNIEVEDGVPDSPQKRYQYIAEKSGQVIGFASGLTNHKWFYLSDMWVLQEYRRQGLGSKLLKMLEEKVKSIGIRHIYTWTSGFINPHFYEKHGYRKFTIFENFFEVDGYHHIGYRKDFEKPVEYDAVFWSAFDKLVTESKIVIDRPKGSHHPKYPDFMYPVDYGYLENTSSMDGGGIDVWKGMDGENIDAIVCTVDLMKRDSEIKILVGCSEDEKQLVLDAHNNSEYMKGILIRRESL